MISSWHGPVEINGVRYASIKDVRKSDYAPHTRLHIRLLQEEKQAPEVHEVRVTVKAYMTKKATAEFDFMRKWNANKPMPLRTMIGTVEKETKGMVYMKLHGDIYAPEVFTCMKCGRTLTNPVSRYFGIGPECGGHNYVHPFKSDEELNAAVEQYRTELQKVIWEGWIIKSAIVEEEKVNG